MKTKNEYEKLLPFYKQFVQLNKTQSALNLWDVHFRLCYEQNILILAERNNKQFKTKVDIENLKTQRKYVMPYDYPYNDFYLGRDDVNDNHIETLFKKILNNISDE